MEKLIHQTLAFYKNNLDIDENQESILKYSIYLVYTYLFGFFTSLALAYILGTFSYVLVMVASISIYRNYSGGAHCSSMRNCILFSSLSVNLLGLLLKHFLFPLPVLLGTIGVTLIFSLWVVYKYAPADTPTKPINSQEKRKKLRNRSYLIISFWFAGTLGWYIYQDSMPPVVFASTIAILWQSMSLPKLGYTFYHGCDILLNKLFKKGGSYI